MHKPFVLINVTAGASPIPQRRQPNKTPQSAADVSSYVAEPWYHGNISCDVAEERLNAQDSDHFLVRKSQSQPGKYVLTVRYGKTTKHFMVREENQCYEVEGSERIFSSLQELIAFYKKHYLTVGWELLTTPCPPQRLKPHPSPIEIQGVSISIVLGEVCNRYSGISLLLLPTHWYQNTCPN